MDNSPCTLQPCAGERSDRLLYCVLGWSPAMTTPMTQIHTNGNLVQRIRRRQLAPGERARPADRTIRCPRAAGEHIRAPAAVVVSTPPAVEVSPLTCSSSSPCSPRPLSPQPHRRHSPSPDRTRSLAWDQPGISIAGKRCQSAFNAWETWPAVVVCIPDTGTQGTQRRPGSMPTDAESAS